MVLGQIAREIFRTGYRGLYRTINFQDKAIDRAWSYGRFNRSVRRGVRHGAGIGAATGYFISQEFNDDIEDVFQTPKRQLPPSGKYSKTRYRSPRRFTGRPRCRPNSDKRRRQSYY